MTQLSICGLYKLQTLYSGDQAGVFVEHRTLKVCYLCAQQYIFIYIYIYINMSCKCETRSGERVAEPSRKVRWRRRTECVEDPLILSLNNSAPAPTSPLHLLHQTNSRSSSGLMSTYTCRSTSRVCRWQRGATSIYCIISCLLSCIKHCWNLITQTAE